MENKKPRISVITIVLNGEKYIEETIKSVINQAYENIQYIVIDGGSTDNTINLIENYRSKIDVFISEKDNGISNAFNKGLSYADGDLIGFLNSDDFYESDALINVSNAYSKLKPTKKKKPFVVFGQTYSIAGNIKSIKTDNNLGWWLTVPFSHCSCFVSLEYFKQFGKFNEDLKIAMDVELLMRGYRQVEYLNMNMFIGNQRIGGVSDINRIKGYIEYYSVAKREFGIFKASFGFLIKYFIQIVKRTKSNA